MDKELFRNNILQWYNQSKRVLPWRDNPNPYHVWVSEIMLQQTRVETVIPYFERFIGELPTIKDLSQVDDDKLNKLWEGLGYYSRVRNLKKAAIKVIEDFGGELPQDKKEIESLPGIGPYTSGAILSISFNKRYTAVDGNVLRVFSRILGIKEDIKSKDIKSYIKEEVEELLPLDYIGDFNQALMEIGATVCLPNGKPICSVCPVNDLCYSYNNGVVDQIPIKQKKKKKKEEDKTVFVIKYNDLIALEKRPESGLLANLYQFPNIDGHLDLNTVKKVFKTSNVKRINDSKHVFTHKVWNMIGYEIVLESDQGYSFYNDEDIKNNYPVPTAFKEYKKHIKI